MTFSFPKIFLELQPGYWTIEPIRRLLVMVLGEFKLPEKASFTQSPDSCLLQLDTSLLTACLAVDKLPYEHRVECWLMWSCSIGGRVRERGEK